MESSSIKLLSTTQVILSSGPDWKLWINQIRTLAECHQIWEYIDPDSENRPTKKAPTEPTIQMVKENAPADASITILNDDEYKTYERLTKQYTINEKAHNKHATALYAIQTKINESVVVALQYYYTGKPVCEWLQILRNAIAPSDQNRKLRVAAQYNRLLSPPRNQNIDVWMASFLLAYNAAKEENLPDVSGDRAVHNFLHVVSTLQPEFTTYWKQKVQNALAKNKPLPTVEQLHGALRNDRDENAIQRGKAPFTALAAFNTTFQGKSQQDASSTSTTIRDRE
ncbi:uncharacterized protein BDZ99DRAFT_481195 [Mytilinidion resinicola]|nr:uncharacterized protein BDZ99DRAFT_481195 [Mytilinidion resinicola]KAF2804364.1 hypothetical protein BDZ99DRAFT_481195 [Mytilinidion resinicola]